ncbi:MAG: HAMP domain-containing histidine kinase [Oscillospiraceae bacterium]|nr:HAMP domain-containing histidine kinase [Oscillospiraceae bacterium]
MILALAITILISCILLFLLILQKKELGNIAKQLRELKSKDTNAIIKSENGTADMLITEINALLKEMRETKVSYNQKNHALEQMMTNISHDLRTPLTSAMGYINLIQHSELSEEEKSRELAIIEKRLIRLEELINSFFELSQIVSSGKEPEKTEINLVSVLEEAIVHYYDDYCDQGRQIVLKCEHRKLIFLSNQNMLLRIFDNLIGNALKHGTGVLTITVEAADNLQITFTNELASPDMDIEHIFDEFYTTDISRTKGNTGLGLAIAKQFTEMLGGDIQASQNGELFILTTQFPK